LMLKKSKIICQRGQKNVYSNRNKIISLTPLADHSAKTHVISPENKT